MPGLLTVETTGNTNTVGELLDNSNMLLTVDKDSGTNNNFEIISAVNKNGSGENFTVTVQGQSATERGDYTLAVDFVTTIAAETISDLMSKSTDMEYAIEDGTEYFHFQVGDDVNTFLTPDRTPLTRQRIRIPKGHSSGRAGRSRRILIAASATIFGFTRQSRQGIILWCRWTGVWIRELHVDAVVPRRWCCQQCGYFSTYYPYHQGDEPSFDWRSCGCALLLD